MSFYTSLTGLKNAQSELDVLSHNISNASTIGFKKSTTSFADIISSSILTDPSLTIGIGSRLSSVKQQFSLGSMTQTGNTLDLAINGDGFFTVANPLSNDISYTRAGSFSVSSEGYIKTDQGDRLQVYSADTSGNVSSTTLHDCQVPTANSAGSPYSGMTITNSGQVVASFGDGSTQYLGVIGLATFQNTTGLKQQGNSLWSATGTSGNATMGQPGTASLGKLMSGTLEQSNVDLASEMVSLIDAQRYFQANSKAIDTFTQVSQNIMNLRTS